MLRYESARGLAQSKSFAQGTLLCESERQGLRLTLWPSYRLFLARSEDAVTHDPEGVGEPDAGNSDRENTIMRSAIE